MFDETLIAYELDDVDAVVSFNAKFDRGFWVRRFPDLYHPWICALRDYSWSGLGRYGRTQAALLAELGHTYDAHRAGPDAWALSVLLAMRAPDGRTFAANMVDAARRVDVRIRAEGAPYACRDLLKADGYRWDPSSKVWWCDVAEDAVPAETARLEAVHPLIRPRLEPVDWFNRHCT